MLAKEREALILRNLDQSGAVTVADLADRLAVTGETIRRDLAKLAKNGRLVRTHGGAVRVEADAADPPFAVRRTDRAEQKRAIGVLAAQSVRPGSVIAIDASTTCLEVARLLPSVVEGQPLTVVSNGLDVVGCLSNRDGIDVICTGGEFDRDGACFVGPIAEATLRRFAFSRAFVSSRGFDVERGASEASSLHAAIKNQMLSLADETWLLIDSSKLGVRSVCSFADPTDFARIVSDAPLPEQSSGRLAADRWHQASRR